MTTHIEPRKAAWLAFRQQQRMTELRSRPLREPDAYGDVPLTEQQLRSASYDGAWISVDMRWDADEQRWIAR